MERERETKAYKAHVLLFPFPAQGHINPAFQFAKRLESKGLKTTLATTVYVAKSMHVTASKVEVETMSDGYDETGWAGAKSAEEFHQRFRDLCSQGLADLIKKYENTSNPVTCLVHDAICPWALDIGKEHGLVVASFFTQACGVSYLFYHVKIGTLIVPVEEPVDSIPGLPTLAVHDLPAQVAKLEFSSSSLDLLMGQFNHPDKADWLLFNSFDHLESEVLKLMRDRWRVRTIGPTTPSMYLDKRVEGDKENSLNMFKPSDENYIKWLNARETGSVVYISFGSIAAFEGEQMEELMWGIRQSTKHFLWVVRETEQSKLPSSFAKETSDKGLVVSWCSQTEVLAHKAVGCFVTHCGWNSTMEALSLGVPMVAMPIIWDQTTNAKFVEDIWESGIRVKVDEKGIVKRDEVESCIREVMEGERGKAIRMNAERWRELAKDAVDAGGSSDVNVEEFVASLTSINI